MTEVIAVEPDPYLRERALSAADAAPVPVRVVDGGAEHLPIDDASCDAAIASLMLCSVADQRAALREMRGVIRPDGELRFYEHVLASNAKWARRQRRLAPLWARGGGGCHPDRDTEPAIAGAGFEIEQIRRFLFAPAWIAKLTAPIILGRAAVHRSATGS